MTAVSYRSVTRHADPTGAHCRGLNHSDSGEIVTHDRCGADVVRRDDGNLYDIVHAGFYQARKFNCWSGTHDCDPKLVELADAERAAALAAGDVTTKSARVEVFKGRKVPKGTVGVVFWVGEDSYSGKPKIGIRDDAGTAHFLLAEHCRTV